MYKCKICSSEIDLNACQVFKSTCIVNKCELVRYKCTVCGVIFGTLDMIDGTVEHVKKAYEFCDTKWKEGDGAIYEIPTFISLNPQKNKKYLNFGSGNTSTTIDTLRKQGYDIIGYEPYLPTNQPNVIKTKEELMTRKFDGIISVNLIEHLQDPVNDLIFMKSLLKDSKCLMAHATACYTYCYEYSAYHLFFLVEKSLDYLCKNTGLKIKICHSYPDYANCVFEQV